MTRRLRGAPADLHGRKEKGAGDGVSPLGGDPLRGRSFERERGDCTAERFELDAHAICVPHDEDENEAPLCYLNTFPRSITSFLPPTFC